jgi:glycosyltransferase involved in cell wall biosynthesis
MRRLVMGGISTGLAHRADLVLTVSEFSRTEIARHLRVSRRKIEVVSNATDSSVRPVSAPASAQASPYLVAFGGGDANKNIPRLIEAFALLAHAVPHQLVLIGRVPATVEQAIQSQPPEIASRIRCTGYVAREEVERCLSGAAVFVFPSFYEGFGLPILEAQAAGVPVACSRAASLPEVAGDAASYFDPDSPARIAAAVAELLKDERRRAALRAKGHENIKRFSWSESARRTLEVYRRVARNGCPQTVI